MELQIISPDECVTSVWEGGKTHEYFIYPPSALYANRDFLFRISRASIEKVPAAFTQFKGYHRFLVMLENSLQVQHNGVQKNFEVNEVFTFLSDDQVVSYTLGSDFNLMVADTLNGKAALHYVNKELTVSAKTLFVFAGKKTAVTINRRSIYLKPYDMLCITNEREENVRMVFTEEVLVIALAVSIQ